MPEAVAAAPALLADALADIQREVEGVESESRSNVALAVAVVAVGVVVVAFALGRRRDRKRRTIVEIRRA